MNDETLPLPGLADDSQTLPRRSLSSFPFHIQGFEILEELGRGGNSLVFKALQQGLNRLVAIKIVPQENARVDTLLRLQLEAEIIARLAHPNIIAIHETGQSEGVHYLVLEYAEGGSLDRLLNGPPIDARQAAELVLPLGRALHAAHMAGVVHRDLKPANVLRMADGTPKVTDFGLAKRLNEADGPTRTGSVMGTPSYMSPEQAMGHTHLVGPTTDVYGLGAILYTLVAARPPFEASDILLTLEAVRFKMPVPVRRWNPRVPRDLETIIAKCLEKEAARRYPSAAELADDLQRFLDGKTITARPTSIAEQLVSLARRRPTLVASWILGSLAVVLAVAVILTVRAWKVAEVARDQAEQATKGADVARQQAEVALQAAEAANQREAQAQEELAEALYINRVQLALQQARTGYVQRARENLNACPKDRRDWEWNLVNRMVTPAIEFRRPERGLREVQYTPSGDLLLAYQTGLIERLSEKGERLLEYEKSEIWPPLEPGAGVARAGGTTRFNVVQSRDGKRLLSTQGLGMVSEWDLETGKRLRSDRLADGNWTLTHLAVHPLLPDMCGSYAGTNMFGDRFPIFQLHQLTRVQDLGPVKGTPTCSEYSRSGKYLVTADTSGAAQIWQLPGYTAVATLQDHLKSVQVVRFHPSANLVMTGSVDGRVNLWSVPQGRRLDSISLPHPVRSAAWSSDGKMLAIGLQDGSIWIYRNNRLDLLGYSHSELNNRTEAVCFRPDDQMLVSAASDGTVRVWDMNDCGELSIPVFQIPSVQPVHISPDCEHMILQHASGVLYRFSPLKNKSLQKVTDQRFYRLSVSADASRIVGQNDRSELWLVDSAGRAEKRIGDGKNVNLLCLSPDGNLLLTVQGSLGKWELVARDLEDNTERWRHPVGNVAQLCFSPDGTEISVVVNFSSWDIRSPQTGKVIWQNNDQRWTQIHYSPSGKRMAALTMNHVCVLDRQSRKILHQIPLTSTTGAAGFTHDDERLAVASMAQVIVFDADRGRVVLELNNPHMYINRLTFSCRGDLHAAGGTIHHSLIVWPVQNRGWRPMQPVPAE